jgi:ubiquinone/menaquinone biosynthesis C-methylase UbiE
MGAAEQFLETQKAIWSAGDWPGFAPMPFEDDSFDRVTSIFGAMFAPRHRRTADELAHVTRLGGILAVTACARRQLREADGAHRVRVVGRWMEHLEKGLGPIVVAKAVLEPQGRWEAARADLEELEQHYNEAGDGSVRVNAEYLLTKALAG